MFDFIINPLAIYCKTKEEADDLSKILNKQGYEWEETTYDKSISYIPCHFESNGKKMVTYDYEFIVTKKTSSLIEESKWNETDNCFILEPNSNKVCLLPRDFIISNYELIGYFMFKTVCKDFGVEGEI